MVRELTADGPAVLVARPEPLRLGPDRCDGSWPRADDDLLVRARAVGVR